MIKVLGKLVALVVKCEDGLKEGQHLKEETDLTCSFKTVGRWKRSCRLERYGRVTKITVYSVWSKTETWVHVIYPIYSTVTHWLHTLKLLSLLDLLQFAHIVQRLLLKVLPHGFHLDVCLKRRRTHSMMITVTGRCKEAKKRNIVMLMRFFWVCIPNLKEPVQKFFI